MKLSCSKFGGVNKSNTMTESASSQSHTASVVEIRTGFPPLITTGAELFYARIFDENQEAVFFGLPLSHLSEITVGYTRGKREGGTHLNANETVFIDNGDVCCAGMEALPVILDRERATLLIWVLVPNANLNVRNSQTNLTCIIFPLVVEPIMFWVDIARSFKRLPDVGLNVLMVVEKKEGTTAHDDALVF